MKTLELKDIVPYFLYGLKIKIGETIRDLTALSLDSPFIFVTLYPGSRQKEMQNICNAKPLLIPLSALTEPEYKDAYDEFSEMQWQDMCDRLDYAGMELLPYEKVCDNISLSVINALFKNHFDVFGLINSGLAIDKKNT